MNQPRLDNRRRDLALIHVAKKELALADAGRADAYADGMARRMFKVERYEWLQPDQLGKVIAALTYDQKRRNRKGKPQ